MTLSLSTTTGSYTFNAPGAQTEDILCTYTVRDGISDPAGTIALAVSVT